MGASWGARRADVRKCAVSGGAAYGEASQRQLTAEAPMPSRLDPAEMPRLDMFDEEFGQDPATILRAERRGLRVLFLLRIALVSGAIPAPPFAPSPPPRPPSP